MNTTTSTMSSFCESIAYKKIIPWITIGLGLFYTAILLFQYCTWCFRQRRAKKRRIDRQRVGEFWRKQAIEIYTQMDSIQTLSPIYNNRQGHHHYQQYYDGLQSFGSSATLVVLSSGSHAYTSEESTTVLQDKKESIFLYSLTDNHKEQTNNKRKKSIYKKFFKLVMKRLNDRYYQQRKRRYLIWQWSVSMGYCKYHHAYYLNTMIDRLLEERKHDNPT
ncbi:uncharacterized protein BX663DRAFT_502755 [Cokeromyces recurvatus]|uniref:uncharacterized protein n=1 Tax=Cokeromyces recurvatus TaxID=90255 RepID=UPI00222099D7|nr:uncharacterized protein BX663DRAFT_502755 [Cokeromyces recurvatus]KAI7904547.1 hypothetical protein BX663DRAFT_502755 [Cokeromyces recurvatus]